MKPNTRLQCLLAATMGWLIAAGSATAANPALLRVQADQRLGRIEPLLYGQFVEHLGRCVNGGLFEPGSPLADTNGFRRDALAKVRELHCHHSNPRRDLPWTLGIRRA